VVVLALLLGARERRAPAGLGWLPVFLLLTLPNARANTTSLVSGGGFLLASFRTVTWPGYARPPRRRGALVGMLLAAAATLRQPSIVPAVLFPLILHAPAVVRAAGAPRKPRREALCDMAVPLFSLVAVLLPWALLSQRSSGTFLFPLLNGNYR